MSEKAPLGWKLCQTVYVTVDIAKKHRHKRQTTDPVGPYLDIYINRLKQHHMIENS